jgi:hypothetical protein
MPVWWHNRIHMDRGTLPAPVAEHDSLNPLVGDITPTSTSTNGKECTKS